jgi:diguanylate cyclase (GGDEF)-like protein/PAS domain S-box-containing protein
MHKSLDRELDGLLQKNSQASSADYHYFLKFITLLTEGAGQSSSFLQHSNIPQKSFSNTIEIKNRKYLKALLSSIPDLIFLVDRNGKYLDVFDEGKEHLLNLPKEEIIGRNIKDIFNTSLAQQFLETLENASSRQKLQYLEYELYLHGEKGCFEARVIPTHLKEFGIDVFMVIIRDITQKKQEENISRIIETVFEEATEGIIIEDARRNVIHINPAMLRILNMKKEQLIGKHTSYLAQMLSPEIQQDIHMAMETKGHWHGEVEIVRKDQKTILGWLTIDIVYDNTDLPSNIVIMFTDISEIHLSRQKMKYLATHDALTDLPNRTLLFEHLNHAISKAKRHKKKGALIFIDIDGFKSINDNYSHRTGDLLLKEFAHRLSHIMRTSDIVGRLSGDEFLLILENIHSIEELLGTIRKIKTLFQTPFLINGVDIDITVSMGIALFPSDGENADQLIHAADQAMYSVKSRGKNGFTFYSKEFSIISNEYFRIYHTLKKAILENNFSILYQPQFSLQDGSLKGIEALLRCNEPKLSDIPISRLITIAEENNIIQGISRFVMSRCCEQIGEWQTLLTAPMKIAVNLSRKELSDENLVQVIQENLSLCCINPEILEFEITESTLLQNTHYAKQNITQLRQLGCSFAIDDYGTGYSSLANLREFKLDKIKIDKSFIEDLENNENDRIIVSATISMVKQLGLTVLAEGVENDKQAALLQKFGCDEVQGYLFSHPLQKEEMTELLRSYQNID